MGERWLLDAADVGRLVGLNRTQVIRLTASHMMPGPVFIGRSPRWRVHELKDWIALKCPVPCGEPHWVWRPTVMLRRADLLVKLRDDVVHAQAEIARLDGLRTEMVRVAVQ